ncbi:MAG: hybrid sensor histidine kinase/response regulator, partial [Anaerolineae bacterium]|nr:hybrid sensor histidine kinase/response regulator [Anaerolineae bacterium]
MSENSEPSSIRLLYLDDNKSEHVFVRNVLDKVSNQTYQVTSVHTFDEAVDAIQSRPYDICLVDFYLNDVLDRTGVDFVRKMVQDTNIACPFILLTVVNEREPDIEGMHAGAVAYIEKRHLRPELLERTIRYTIEQYRIRRELEDLYTQVRELESFKASLVRLAGHNLRNHITNVKLSARMLENLVEHSDTAARNLYRISQAVETMEQLTTDILMLERLSLTSDVLDSVIDVLDLTNEICTQYQNYGLKAGQRLKYMPLDSDLHIRCEKTQFREAIRNLVSNASKYSRDNGVIIVEVTGTANSVEISVEDNGYGIPKDKQSELFQPFVRVLTEET